LFDDDVHALHNFMTPTTGAVQIYQIFEFVAVSGGYNAISEPEGCSLCS